MPKLDGYRSLEIIHLSKRLVVACYELTHELPSEEKTNFSRYIRTAALNLHMNIAQGVFLQPNKRKKFIRNAKSALIIIDAASEILAELGLKTREEVEAVTRISSSCYQMLDQL